MFANPQVATFCNGQLRPLVDKYLGLYYACKEAQDIYVAQGIAAQLGADNNAIVDDGSDQDGRSRLTVGAAKSAIAAIGGLITAVETSSGAVRTALATVAVNPS